MAGTVVKGAFIVAGKRTPFGTFGGSLSGYSSVKLMTICATATMEAGGVKPEMIDSFIVGNVITCTSADAPYLARHAMLYCKVPDSKHGYNVNRLCGSGFQSVINGAQEIVMGDSKVALCGGVEVMSQSPFALRNMRFGTKLGNVYNTEDTLWTALTDSYCKLPMGVTAENVGAKFNMTRKEVEEYAYNSQQRWAAAQKAGIFNQEICPVKIKVKGKDVDMTIDEHPKPKTTLEVMAKLPTVFKKDGLISPAVASGINDGAGAVIVASEAACKEYNLKPLARIASYGVAGIDPKLMGLGPVPAINAALKAAGKTINDMDIIEINEAFAPQALGCAKELKVDMAKFNPNGGAIAIGHPLAASGSRITAHVTHELNRKNVKNAVVSACIGGGQGIAIVLEKA